MKVRLDHYAIQPHIYAALRIGADVAVLSALEGERAEFAAIGKGSECIYSARLSVEIVEPGEVSIPLDRSKGLLASYSDGTTTLSDGGKGCRWLHEGAQSSLAVVGPRTLPGVSELAPDEWHECDVADFLAAYAPTVAAASKDPVRYGLYGVHMGIQADGDTYLTASDGHRAVRRRLPLVVPAAAPGMVLLPLDLAKHMAKWTGALRFGFAGLDGTWLVCECGRTHMRFRTLAGEFPDVNQVLPARTPYRVTVSRAALMHAVKAAEPATTARRGEERTSKPVVLSLDADSVRVSRATVYGQHTSEVALTGVELPQPLAVGFNGGWLLEALDHFGADTVTIALAHVLSPAVISAAGCDGWTVLMPMRID